MRNASPMGTSVKCTCAAHASTPPDRCTGRGVLDASCFVFPKFKMQAMIDVAESGHDWVNISGTRHQGRTGPNGVAVAAGSLFTGRSDSSVTRAGWTICWSATTPPPS